MEGTVVVAGLTVVGVRAMVDPLVLPVAGGLSEVDVVVMRPAVVVGSPTDSSGEPHEAAMSDTAKTAAKRLVAIFGCRKLPDIVVFAAWIYQPGMSSQALRFRVSRSLAWR